MVPGAQRPRGVVTASVQGPIGDVVVILLGLHGSPLFVPGIADPFWLDPVGHFAMAFGVPQSGAPVVATQMVPNLPSLRGALFSWQVVSYGAVGFQTSVPGPYVLR